MDTPAPQGFPSMIGAGNQALTQPAVETPRRIWQQMEEMRPEDDWTGMSNSAERRKLQNRLKQRLYIMSFYSYKMVGFRALFCDYRAS